MFSSGPTLIRNKVLEWNNLVARIANIGLQVERDTFFAFQKYGSFTLNSICTHLISMVIIVSQQIWHLTMSLKIKKLWLLKRGVILTKHNLARKNWSRNKSYVFCCRDETIRHLFFYCTYAKFLWQTIYLVRVYNLP